MRQGEHLESEISVLVGMVVAAAFAAMVGATIGGNVDYAHSTNNPGLSDVSRAVWCLGCWCSFCPVGLLALMVLTLLLMLGLQPHELTPRFWILTLAIWAIGLFNGTRYAAISALVARMRASTPSGSVPVWFVLLAGLDTLLGSAVILFYRYQWLKWYFYQIPARH